MSQQKNDRISAPVCRRLTTKAYPYAVDKRLSDQRVKVLFSWEVFGNIRMFFTSLIPI